MKVVQRTDVYVGLFLIVIVGAILAALFFTSGWGIRKWDLFVRADNVQGVAVDNKVYYQGLEVGRVAAINAKQGLRPGRLPFIIRTELLAEFAEGDSLKLPRSSALQITSNVLGATHEAKDLEQLDKGLHIVDPIMGVAHWKRDSKVEPEEIELTFERGVPVAISGKRFGSLFELFSELNRIGGRHGLGMSDQIENRVIDAKSRGIYEAPGMALLHIGYERLLSAIHNESTLELYATLGRRLGRILYEGKWFDPEGMLLKDALLRWLAPSVSGSVTLELRRGDDYSILKTEADYMAYAPEKLSMEKVASGSWLARTNAFSSVRA